MDEFTLFYAWQSDINNKINRYVIRDAAKAALKILAKDSSLEESPRLDSDTQEVAGTPEVASTIFDKINKAGLFLADVTFVGKSKDGDFMPNSNVLLELGYAASRIGWSRTILILNTAFGAPDELIFDLRHRRWPITYHLNNEEKSSVREQETHLTNELVTAIRMADQEEYASVENMISKLDYYCLRWMFDLGKKDWFSSPVHTTMGDILANQMTDSALIRLLDFGILRCDVNPLSSEYAYHWTYFGKLVLYKLGLRDRSK